MAALRLVQKIPDAIAPAEVVLWQLANGAMKSSMLGVATRLGIADILASGPRSASELAERTGSLPSMMMRLLRTLSALGVFAQTNRGTFANNRCSEKLRANVDGSMREAVLYLTSASNLDAWRALEVSIRTGECAFTAHHGESIWDWFSSHQAEGADFATAMSRVTLQESAMIASLYPWNSIQSLCDVGGGTGGLLSELLVRNSTLRGVLCDVPANLARAKELFSDREVLDRVTLVPASFFDEVAPGCEGYLLKNILHDWDDRQALKILTVVRKAMGPNSKLLLVEALVETLERRPEVLMSDMQMAVVCGGKERTFDEYCELLDHVGLTARRVYRGPLNSVLEARAVA